LSRVLMEETGTLGVRVYPCQRHILSRESIAVDVRVNGVEELVRVKVARDLRGGIIQVKPEYDDVERIARKTGRPLREVMELARAKAREALSKG
ncbi:MAG: nickel insertion protein, partial [Candidatus Bathyarchaeia archaeon]